MMPAVDMGVDMPEVDVQTPALNERDLFPNRLCIRLKELTMFGATLNCIRCLANATNGLILCRACGRVLQKKQGTVEAGAGRDEGGT